MAELDVIKDDIEFDQGTADIALVRKAYANYEAHMDRADAVSEELVKKENFADIAENVAEKRAEHRAALEAHEGAMPDGIRTHVANIVERSREAQVQVLEKVENPVARARIEDNIQRHQAHYLEARDRWQEARDEIRLKSVYEEHGGIPRDEVDKLRAGTLQRIDEIKERRERHHAEIKERFEEERIEHEKEEIKMRAKLQDAGFESEDEALEAYEASNDGDRAKLRAFFGVSEQEANAHLNEVKALRAEHGDEWQVRMRERKMEEAREFEREFDREFEARMDDEKRFDREFEMRMEDGREFEREFDGDFDRFEEFIPEFEGRPMFDGEGFDFDRGPRPDMMPMFDGDRPEFEEGEHEDRPHIEHRPEFEDRPHFDGPPEFEEHPQGEGFRFEPGDRPEFDRHDDEDGFRPEFGEGSEMNGRIPHEDAGDVREDERLHEIQEVYRRDTELRPGDVLTAPPAFDDHDRFTDEGPRHEIGDVAPQIEPQGGPVGESHQGGPPPFQPQP